MFVFFHGKRNQRGRSWNNIRIINYVALIWKEIVAGTRRTVILVTVWLLVGRSILLDLLIRTFTRMNISMTIDTNGIVWSPGYVTCPHPAVSRLTSQLVFSVSILVQFFSVSAYFTTRVLNSLRSQHNNTWVGFLQGPWWQASAVLLTRITKYWWQSPDYSRKLVHPFLIFVRLDTIFANLLTLI